MYPITDFGGASMSVLIVDESKTVQGRSQIWDGGGSPTSYLTLRTAKLLYANGLDREMLGAIPLNFNGEDADLFKSMPRDIHVFAPQDTLPGLPHGFRGETELCEKSRHLWLPPTERYFQNLRRLSDSYGLVGGQVTQQLTPGGHLPMSYEIDRLNREHWPQAYHIGLLQLPTQHRGLWKNLDRYPGWPNDIHEELPIILADNRHARRIDSAIPTLIATVIAAKWMTDRRQHALMEMLQQISSRHQLLGIAEAHVDVPVIDFNWWDRTWKGLILRRQPGVAEQGIPSRVAQLIIDLLQETARLIHGPELDPNEPMFAGVGGLPMPPTNDAQARKEARQRFQESVTNLVADGLGRKGQVLPPGLDIVWASMVEHLPNNFIRIPAVLVYPIPGRTARDYIDEMLADGRRVA
jgi:hypothetical protein